MRLSSKRVGAVIAAAAVCFGAACVQRSPATKPPKPVPIVRPPPGAVGIAATGAAAIAAPQTAQPGQPPSQITEADVRAYVSSHRVPGTIQATNVRILSATLVANQQVSSALGTPRIDVSDQQPMWVVLLSGKFTFSGPPRASAVFPYAVEVFNARTGQLMQYGGLGRAPRITAR